MAEASKTEAPTYHVDRLLAESWDRFGVEAHVVAGALAAQSSRKQNFTEDEVKSAVEKWLKKPVETDNPIGSNEEA